MERARALSHLVWNRWICSHKSQQVGAVFHCPRRRHQHYDSAGTFGIAADISLSLGVAYSAMQKSDKVKSCPFIELLSDMLALEVSTAENYILKENPALFTPLLAGET